MIDIHSDVKVFYVRCKCGLIVLSSIKFNDGDLVKHELCTLKEGGK